MQGMVRGGESLTKALDAEHRAEMARDDPDLELREMADVLTVDWSVPSQVFMPQNNHGRDEQRLRTRTALR